MTDRPEASVLYVNADSVLKFSSFVKTARRQPEIRIRFGCRGKKSKGFVARSQIKKKENPGGLPEHAFEAQIYR
jgi:hypothetical protein